MELGYGKHRLLRLIKKRNEGDRTYNIAAIEPIVTIVPLLRFAMYGATALDTLRTEKVFSSNALRA